MAILRNPHNAAASSASDSSPAHATNGSSAEAVRASTDGVSSDRTRSTGSLSRQSLHLYVEALEEAWNEHIANVDLPRPDVPQFLPDASAALAQGVDFDQLAAELLCVDFERRLQIESEARIECYQDILPELWNNDFVRTQLAYEQYRLVEATRLVSKPTPNSKRQVAPLLPTKGDVDASVVSQPSNSMNAKRVTDTIETSIDLRSWYARHYEIDTSNWAPLASRSAAKDEEEKRLPLPEVGKNFEGFTIVEHLAPCHDGGVFLAEQPVLADRLVVLKITGDHWHESDRLARLQQTNVMPVYSVHHCGRWQMVCMPFMGRATLQHVLTRLKQNNERAFDRLQRADWIKAIERENSEGRSASESHAPSAVLASARGDSLRDSHERTVLHLFVRLSRGLTHAHERGLLHRDIKPANILITRSGEPLLFDFDLSHELSRPSRSEVGGTLRYMSPEQRMEFAGEPTRVDERSDIYSLGLVMFESLTGRHPFPDFDDSLLTSYVVASESLSASTVSVREHCPSLSLSIDSILCRCLAPQPEDRYASASQLREDLKRHLDHLPLRHAPNRSYRERMRKWAKRHPRLTSMSVVCSFACVLVSMVLAIAWLRGEQIQRYEAQAAWQRFEELADEASAPLVVSWHEAAGVESGFAAADKAFQVFGIPGQRNAEQRQLVAKLSPPMRNRLADLETDLHFLVAAAHRKHAELAPASGQDHYLQALSHNELALAAATSRGDAGLLRQKVEILNRLGREEEAKAIDLSSTQPATSPHRRHPFEEVVAGQYEAALEFLRDRRAKAPHDFTTTFLMGICHYRQQALHDAAEEFTRSIALWPHSHFPYYMRGLVYFDSDPHRAVRDFQQALKRAPASPSIYHNLALAYEASHKLDIADEKLAEARVKLEAVVSTMQRAMSRFQPRPSWHDLRARALEQLGRTSEASLDRKAILTCPAVTAEDWCILASATLEDSAQDDVAQRALNQLNTGLKLFPASYRLTHNKVVVLAEHLEQPETAQTFLDEVIAERPNDIRSRLLRVEVMIMQALGTEALIELSKILELDGTASTQYHVARLLVAINPDSPVHQQQALPLLEAAINRDREWLAAAKQDATLRPLVSLLEP